MRSQTAYDEITGAEDILDGDKIRRRLEYLQAEAEAFEGTIGSDEDPLTEDEREELSALVDLYSEIGKDSTLIADHYFKEYAQQLAEDIGAISDDAAWPATCIDWDRAADELSSDYSQVEYRGTTYYVRD